ncbi:MAG TPA: hypothetical protein VJ673_23370 [Aromatoleum sp.]|uniref:hypothetical protein n=1 Tax=Aromatoleum sp. TaxID=2307007 RepID=UPI002B47A08A|nr:hypothetical protein [Aromatoleum sp.]HJV28639.1 hypothetical protein [Aromatoleum sp.]
MATIVIKDLPENMDLDRQAMQAITGGARLRGRPGVAVRAVPRAQRPETQPAKRRPAMTTLFK